MQSLLILYTHFRKYSYFIQKLLQMFYSFLSHYFTLLMTKWSYIFGHFFLIKSIFIRTLYPLHLWQHRGSFRVFRVWSNKLSTPGLGDFLFFFFFFSKSSQTCLIGTFGRTSLRSVLRSLTGSKSDWACCCLHSALGHCHVGGDPSPQSEFFFLHFFYLPCQKWTQHKEPTVL